MPSVQVVDFGPSMMSDTLGKMAQGFSNTVFDLAKEKRDKELLDDIDKLPMELEDKILELSKAYGVDPSYKNDRIGNLLKVAELRSKKDKTAVEMITAQRLKTQAELQSKKYQDTVDGISPTAKKDAAIRAENARRIELQENRLENSIKQKHKDYPDRVAKHISSQLRDSGETMSSNDRAQMTDIITNLVQGQDLPIGDAYTQAYDAIQQKNELVKNVMAVPKPQNEGGGMFSSGKPPSPDRIAKSKQDLFNQLIQLFDQGVRSQTDLRKIAKKGGWDDAESNEVLQKVFQAKLAKYQPPKSQKTDDMTAEQRKLLLRSVLQ